MASVVATTSNVARWTFTDTIVDAASLTPDSLQIGGNAWDGFVGSGPDWIDMGYFNPVNPGDAWTFVPPSDVIWSGGVDPPPSSGTVA